MKKLLSLVLILGIFVSVLAPVTSAQEEIISQKEPLTFENKTISILGDSICTFENYSSGTAAETSNSTIKNNRDYYKPGRFDVTVNDTWWMQAAKRLGARILVNNSFSNTTIFSPFSNGNELGYLSRPYNLHDDTGENAGEEPDIIVVYMGTNDMSYHKSRLGSHSELNYDDLISSVNDDFAYRKPQTSAEAYAIMLHKITTTYENAEVYCFTTLPRYFESASDRRLLENFNKTIEKIADDFNCYTVDLYNDSGLTCETSNLNRYLYEGYIHPNKKGMDAIENAFISALYENSKYASDKTIHSVSYDLNNVIADQGTQTQVIEGEKFEASFTNLKYGKLNAEIIMNGTDITEAVFNDNRISIPSVEGNVKITVSVEDDNRSFYNYRFEKNNNRLFNIQGDENYSNDAVEIDKNIYKTEKDINLYYDKSWTLITRVNCSTTGRTTILSGDENNAFDFVYDGKRNIIGFLDKTNNKTIYSFDLREHKISTNEAHTFKIVNNHNIYGENTFKVWVDTVEIGSIDSRFINLAFYDKNTSALNETDFIFNTINSENVEYIQVWESENVANHKHIFMYPQIVPATCTEYGSTTSTCDCGIKKVEPNIPPTGHTEGKWITEKETSALEPGEQTTKCVICNEIVQTKVIPQLKCEKPVIKTVENTDTGIKVTWNKTEGADSYRVYRHLINGKWEYLCTTTELTFIDTNIKNGYWYYYTVRAVNEAGYSDFYTNKSVQALNTPYFKSATNTNNGITIQWGAIKGAQGYYLYRKAGNNNWQYYCRVNGTSYTDKNVKNGVTYQYRIKACRNKTVSGFRYTPLTICRMTSPVLKTPINTDSGVKIQWNKVTGAAGYFVYKKVGGYWKYLGKTSITSFTDTSAKPGSTSTYTVKAYDSTGKHSTYNTKGITFKRLTTPYVKGANVTNNNINIYWNSVTGANGYYVYRKTEGSNWKYIGKTAATNFADNICYNITTLSL